MSFDASPHLIAAMALILLLGAIVKGAMGVGMPLISIPLLSLLISPPVAIGLLAAPVLASNAIQVYETRALSLSIKRMALLLGCQFITMALTIRWTTTISAAALNQWVGASIALTALLLMFKPRFHIPASIEPLCSALVGAAAGFVGGISAMTGPVVIAYLIALRMNRDTFVGTISMVYLLTAVPLYGLMLWYGRFGLDVVGWSLLSLLPMLVGMQLGRRLRAYLDEQRFRQLLLVFLLAMALSLFFKA
jgi:uncharacterized membrane protein YfcA